MKRKLTKADKMRLFAFFVLGIIILSTIYFINTQKEKKPEPMTTDLPLKMEEKTFQFEMGFQEIQQEIKLQITNDNDVDKKYTLAVDNLKNPLSAQRFLKYNLWIDEKPMVDHEVFPKRNSPLLNGATINAHSTVNIKITLWYQPSTNETDMGKKITGKFVINT